MTMDDGAATEIAAAPAMSVEGLVFDYPTLRALHGVSFAVERGSVTALVGPNGAGKTTLLRCMAALEIPFAGRVLIEGLDAHRDPRAAHRRIGYLSDFFGLYDELSVDRCLRHAAAMHGLQGTDERAAVDRVLGQLDLVGLAHRPAGELSRGQRQRLAIAQAIVHQPAIVLLDEPASGLDPLARQSLSDLLLGLRDGGMTLIVSSHILAELEDYSSHVLVMDRGRLVEHRAIAGAGTEAVTLALELAAPCADIAARLAAVEGVSGVVADGLGASFRGPGDAAFRHRLLKVLIEGGVPVSGLAERRLGLRDIYRSVATADEGRP